MATETRYNVALLERIRDRIEDEEQHDQSLWARISRAVLKTIPSRWTSNYGENYITVSCPTAACVAGWAASMSNVPMLFDEADISYSYGHAESSHVLVDGQIEHISTYARKVLGLTANEADALFDGEWSNEETIENLSDIIIAAKHGKEWDIRYHGQDDYDGADD